MRWPGECLCIILFGRVGRSQGNLYSSRGIGFLRCWLAWIGGSVFVIKHINSPLLMVLLYNFIEPSMGELPRSKQGMRLSFLIWSRRWESLPLEFSIGHS